MKTFFLNLTYILEKNPKIYWCVIMGIALCSVLYIVEVVHIQSLLPDVKVQDTSVLRATIDPIAQRYSWARLAVIIMAIIAANFQYFKTKKSLNL
ncbi:hypothetical protein [Acinetobacter wuhouensis]|uniref:Uncharacterized protein n=1 Tax=Acinetobacter wuhouensis TaxID=1879050 RepID=A0A4Q7AHR8_9GAMM|nr:hypothetical protein [Acinetobacter wuhouensis]RZG47531.1 hypothetical protein EXU28_06295 [Acinetobacter wuhouensis]